jgi:hypothetical protein
MSSRCIGKVVVEVRYPPAHVFLDRRGEILDEVAATLGAESDVTLGPGHIEVQAASNLVVRCGPGNFSVQQHSPKTIALCEQVAPRVWKTLTAKGLERRATRFGTRFYVWWPVADESAGWRKLRESGLAPVSEHWTRVFGEPSLLTPTSVVRSDDGVRTRVNVDVAENIVGRPGAAGAAPPDEVYTQLGIPHWAMQLDVDIARDRAGVFPLSPDDVASGLRANWQVVRSWLEPLDALLGDHDA